MRIIRVADTPGESLLKNVYAKLRNFRPYRLHGPEVVWDFLNKHQSKFLRDDSLESFIWYVSGGILRQKEVISSKASQGSTLVFGPNIQFEDKSIRDFINTLDNYRIVVPSKWVSDYFKALRFFPSENIIIWPSGINLEFWKVGKFPRKRNSVILYIKGHQDPQMVETARLMIKNRGLNPVFVRYGNYNIYTYRRKLRKARALLHFGVSESQGISLLESWAINVPTGVVAVKTYSDPYGVAHPASAAPYLDDATGSFLNPGSKFGSDLSVFLSRLDNFSPRKSVQERFAANLIFESFKISLGKNH